MDFLKPLSPSPALAKVRDFVREKVPFVANDRYFYPDIEYIFSLVQDGTLVDILEQEIGELEF